MFNDCYGIFRDKAKFKKILYLVSFFLQKSITSV